MSASEARKLGLELNEDRRFQERFWRAERIAWIVLAAIVVIALLGFTGRGGPFAQTMARTPEGAVEYPRITRWAAADQVVVTFGGGGDQGVLAIDRSFSKVFAIDSIQPQPMASVATAEGQRLTFRLEPATAPRTATLHVRAVRPAIPLRTQLRIGDGPPATLTTLVLP